MLVLFALIVRGLAPGLPAARADELPVDMKAIKSRIAEFKGKRLVLNGLVTLDAATAKALAAFQGEWLGLSDLRTLDAETAQALAGCDSMRLDLSGLQKLDAATARPLAGFRGQMLVLNGLMTLDPETAAALAEYGGQSLQLSGLKSLDADAAKALVKSKAWDGNLPRLSTLDAPTAASLAEFQGNHLMFVDLTTLDADTAGALSRFKGGLFLQGLTSLDAATAQALGEYEGMFGLDEELLAKLVADHPLDPQTALVYARLANGELAFVTAFDSPDSVEIAKALATRKGRLSLPNLKKISPKTLTALIVKQAVEIPLIETLELIPEPDGSPTDDFVVPQWLEDRQKQQQAKQPDE
jgi:hypothetical protein